MVSLLGLRILSALVGIPIILVALWLGRVTYFVTVSIGVALAAVELARLLEEKGIIHSKVQLVVSALAFPLMAYIGLLEEYFGLLFAALLLYNFIRQLLSGRVKDYSFYVSTVILVPIYTGFLPGHLILIRGLPGNAGLHLSLLTFIITWANDTFAYFVGIKHGRRKLCPKISPKKTIEGALGGLAGGVAVVFAMAALASLLGIEVLFPTRHLFFMSLLGCIAGTLGDLTESAIKRDVGVKDSGHIIPGHGGILDRFDSLFFIAPVIYYYAKLLMGL